MQSLYLFSDSMRWIFGRILNTLAWLGRLLYLSTIDQEVCPKLWIFLIIGTGWIFPLKEKAQKLNLPKCLLGFLFWNNLQSLRGIANKQTKRNSCRNRVGIILLTILEIVPRIIGNFSLMKGPLQNDSQPNGAARKFQKVGESLDTN